MGVQTALGSQRPGQAPARAPAPKVASQPSQLKAAKSKKASTFWRRLQPEQKKSLGEDSTTLLQLNAAHSRQYASPSGEEKELMKGFTSQDACKASVLGDPEKTTCKAIALNRAKIFAVQEALASATLNNIDLPAAEELQKIVDSVTDAYWPPP